MGARGKFGEHEKSVRVSWGVEKINSSFLSALQTSQVAAMFYLLFWASCAIKTND